MATIINLTPHSINIIAEDGNVLKTYAPSGVIARCISVRTPSGELDGVRINRTSFGEVEGLPEYKEETYYIVSALTANGAPERRDLLLTDEAVRDEAGRIVGCKALAFAH